MDLTSPGRVLGNRYELVEPLARGGMATVWIADDPVLSRRVAVKVLRPDLAADDATRARFRHEAIAAARLNHPNIVTTLDTGDDDGTAYIVMELVDGTNLRRLVDERGALPVRDVLRIGRQIADALEAAHRRARPPRRQAGERARGVERPRRCHRRSAPGPGEGDRLRDREGGGLRRPDAHRHGDGDRALPRARAGQRAGSRRADRRLRARAPALRAVLRAPTVRRRHRHRDRDGTPHHDTAVDPCRAARRPARARRRRAPVPRSRPGAALHVGRRGQPRARARGAGRNGRPPASFPPGPAPAAAVRPTAGSTTPPSTRRTTTPAAAATRPVAPRRRRRSWVWVVVVLVLAVAAGIGAYVVVRDQASNSAGGSSAAGLPPAHDAVLTAADFDPFGDDGVEDPAGVANVLDGDPATVWSTAQYQDFAALKPGVGIRVDLAPESAIGAVTVATRQAGWSASIYVSADATAPTSLDGWGAPVAQGSDLGETHRFAIDPARGGRSVLVWFTTLPNGPQGEQLEVTGIELG